MTKREGLGTIIWSIDGVGESRGHEALVDGEGCFVPLIGGVGGGGLGAVGGHQLLVDGVVDVLADLAGVAAAESDDKDFRVITRWPGVASAARGIRLISLAFRTSILVETLHQRGLRRA